jgi:hypothetical protein
MIQPTVMNAGTTYGRDTSAANNYGLGKSFTSTLQMKKKSNASAATPSIWWLVLFAFVLGVL